MELKSRINKTKKYNKPTTEIFFENGWFSFSRLANHNKYKHLGLDDALLFCRWRDGCRTEERLMRPKRKFVRTKERIDNWLYEGCTPEQIKALKIGTNKALLEVG